MNEQVRHPYRLEDMTEPSGAAAEGRSVFTRPAKPPRRQPGLSRDRIVEASIALLDREGPASLTMRKVAAELGVHATSLYWHVERREDLVDLAVDHVLAPEAAAPLAQLDWDATVREVACRLYAAFTRHPWAALFAGTRPAIGPNALVLAGQLISALAATGATERDQAIAGTAVSNFVLGAATAAAGAQAMGPSDPESPQAKEVFARVSAVAETPDSHRVWQSFFDEGLDLLLTGIHARLDAKDAGSGGS